jgi:hypothetical protein
MTLWITLLSAFMTAPVTFGQTESRVDIPTVRFCDLIKNPNRYDGQIIRIEAILLENQTPRLDGGDPFLYHAGCTRTDFSVVVEWSKSFKETVMVHDTLERIRNKPDRNGNTRTAVTVVGQFHGSGKRKYGHLDWADGQFVIHTLEKAAPVAPNR